MELLNGVDYPFLRQLVLSLSQNVLDPARDYLFETRLTGVLRSQGICHLEELVALLKQRKDPELERSVAEAMTINETSFFRDSHPFEVLRTELLPPLIDARKPSRTLRIWSAACSTGQEAYSIAMLIAEHFPQLSNWNIRIEGTDISSEVVERARQGVYQRLEMNRGLPARYVVRYFEHRGEDWTVNQSIQKMCNFRRANLCGAHPPFTRADDRFDAIFLRNVMLYFSQETRKALLAYVRKVLAPDGALILGSTEQPADPENWTPVLTGGSCHFKPTRPN